MTDACVQLPEIHYKYTHQQMYTLSKKVFSFGVLATQTLKRAKKQTKPDASSSETREHPSFSCLSALYLCSVFSLFHSLPQA